MGDTNINPNDININPNQVILVDRIEKYKTKQRKIAEEKDKIERGKHQKLMKLINIKDDEVGKKAYSSVESTLSKLWERYRVYFDFDKLSLNETNRTFDVFGVTGYLLNINDDDEYQNLSHIYVFEHKSTWHVILIWKHTLNDSNLFEYVNNNPSENKINILLLLENKPELLIDNNYAKFKSKANGGKSKRRKSKTRKSKRRTRK